MREQCQVFATSLLDHARTSLELEILLNYDPEAGPGDIWQPGERQTLERLKLAIKFKQKKVIHFRSLKLQVAYSYDTSSLCLHSPSYSIYFPTICYLQNHQHATLTGSKSIILAPSSCNLINFSCPLCRLSNRYILYNVFLRQ